jgi:hypothetical protein
VSRHHPVDATYERRLPHRETVDQSLFVTFRLHGSLPAHRVFLPDSLARSGKAFVAMDRLLDRGANGQLYLHRPELAGMVLAALQDGERKFHRYQLHAYVVMPNHVHILVTPKVVATRWLAPLKGFTAYRANESPAARVKPFGRTKATITWCDPEPSSTRPASVVERGKPPERRLRPRLAAPQFVT